MGSKGTTFLWDLASSAAGAMTTDVLPHTVDIYRGHKKAVLDVTQTTDSVHVLTASADETVGVWSMETGNMVRRLRGHQSYVNSVATCVPNVGGRGGALTSSTRNIVASVDDDGKCLLWDLRTKESIGSMSCDWPMTSCCFGLNGTTHFFAGGLDNMIYQYDLRAGLNQGRFLRHYGGGGGGEEKKNKGRQCHNDTITGLSLSPCGTYMLSNGMDEKMIQWDVRSYVGNEEETGRVVSVFQGHKHNFEKLMLRCGWSADGKSVTCGSSDSMVNVWKVETKEHVYALPGHRGTVTDVTFHPTEPVIASCGIDGQIYLGELEL
jgi:Prp8 binding protein